MDAAKTATATFNQVQSPPKTARCVVPNVKGKPLATAKARVAAGHCRTGTVTRAKSRTVAKGKVISQRPKAGTKLASGAKISLVVSRGRR
jgi:beta-lactam-binding protein with PASTA domain